MKSPGVQSGNGRVSIVFALVALVCTSGASVMGEDSERVSPLQKAAQRLLELERYRSLRSSRQFQTVLIDYLQGKLLDQDSLKKVGEEFSRDRVEVGLGTAFVEDLLSREAEHVAARMAILDGLGTLDSGAYLGVVAGEPGAVMIPAVDGFDVVQTTVIDKGPRKVFGPIEIFAGGAESFLCRYRQGQSLERMDVFEPAWTTQLAGVCSGYFRRGNEILLLLLDGTILRINNRGDIATLGRAILPDRKLHGDRCLACCGIADADGDQIHLAFEVESAGIHRILFQEFKFADLSTEETFEIHLSGRIPHLVLLECTGGGMEYLAFDVAKHELVFQSKKGVRRSSFFDEQEQLEFALVKQALECMSAFAGSNSSLKLDTTFGRLSADELMLLALRRQVRLAGTAENRRVVFPLPVSKRLKVASVRDGVIQENLLPTKSAVAVFAASIAGDGMLIFTREVKLHLAANPIDGRRPDRVVESFYRVYRIGTNGARYVDDWRRADRDDGAAQPQDWMLNAMPVGNDVMLVVSPRTANDRKSSKTHVLRFNLDGTLKADQTKGDD